MATRGRRAMSGSYQVRGWDAEDLGGKSGHEFRIGTETRGQFRLYECISEMKKGSPSGYDAETGERSAGSECSPGEPYEQPSLYRIRRSQENHQFLCQDRRRRDCGRRQRCRRNAQALRHWAAARPQPWRGAMEATLFSGWIYDTLQALRRAVGDGASRQNESHQRGQEEERHASTPAPSPTWCAAICCRPAMWPRRAFANCAACCAIAAWW